MDRGSRADCLEILRLEPQQPRAWVIGAPAESPLYWTLCDVSGRRNAALVLLFADDAEAKRAMGSLDFADPRERTVKDLRAYATATVARALGHPRLLVWPLEVVFGRSTKLPRDLACADVDILLLPRREPCPGQFAIVRRSALKTQVVCENPRQLQWATAA